MDNGLGYYFVKDDAQFEAQLDKTRGPIVKKGVESRQHVLYGLTSGTLIGESNGSSICII